MNAQALEMIVRQSVSRQRLLGTVALGAMVLAGAVFVYGATPLLGTLVASTGDPAEAVAPEKMTRQQGEFNTLLASAGEAIVAREPWGKVSIGKPTARPSGPPAAPTRYAGPAIVGMIADSVWFADGKHVRVGQTAEGFGGVTVLSVDAPWSARVRWMEGEFTVSLFDRDATKWSQPMSVWSGPPPIVAAPPAPANAPGAAGATANGRRPDAQPSVAGGPPGAPGSVRGPGGAQGLPGLPPGTVVTGSTGAVIGEGVQIIHGEGGTVVVTSSAGSAPPPPPPPPPPPAPAEEEPEK
ncbi:MAG: hypothetical protein AB7K52_00155 [Phycisphaerales bacterium]